MVEKIACEICKKLIDPRGMSLHLASHAWKNIRKNKKVEDKEDDWLI